MGQKTQYNPDNLSGWGVVSVWAGNQVDKFKQSGS
jgi:hypothetical protein